MMKVNDKNLAKYLFLRTSNKSDVEVSSVISKFVEYLRENGKISHKERIIDLYQEIKDEFLNERTVIVRSRYPVNDNLKSLIERKYQGRHPNERVKILEYTDDEIIGGLSIRSRDELLDLTINNQISNIKDILLK